MASKLSVIERRARPAARKRVETLGGSARRAGDGSVRQRSSEQARRLAWPSFAWMGAESAIATTAGAFAGTFAAGRRGARRSLARMWNRRNPHARRHGCLRAFRLRGSRGKEES